MASVEMEQRKMEARRHRESIVRFNLISLIWVVLASAALLPGQQNPTAPQNRYVQLNRKSYFVVFFVKGERWSAPRPKEEMDRLLQGHLAYLREHVESGDYALTGPLVDDGPIRGIIVLGTDSAEKAMRIVNGDPMVQSKQFGAEVHPAMFPTYRPCGLSIRQRQGSSSRGSKICR